MKRFVIIFAVCTLIMAPVKKSHALDAKSKAFLIMCTYGTVGGALLGFASMAFGTNSRAIAQGASLGLYAGIAFGSYVIFSHGQKQAPGSLEGEYYEDPYGPEPLPPIDGGGTGFDSNIPEDSSGGGGFFGQRFEPVEQSDFYQYRLKDASARSFNMPLYINFYNAQF